MRSAISVCALLLALGACFGLVSGQYRGPALEGTVGRSMPYAAIVDDFDREMTGSVERTLTTGSIGHAGTAPLTLTDEQRGLIFLGVMNLPDIPDTFLHVPPPGLALPATVELYDIPAMVVRRIPQVTGYKFAKLDDRILVVSAQTRQVADMIPRYKLVFH